MRETGVSRRSWRVVAIGVVALIAALVLWGPTRYRVDTTRRVASAAETPVGPNAAVHASVAASARASEPMETHEPGEHPHPITAAHERIYRENNLVGALNLAVDLEDAIEIRELLVQYRAEYPEDAHRLQLGYELIAECLERLDASTQQRAQRFWDTEIRSQTRRYVRRYCLERAVTS